MSAIPEKRQREQILVVDDEAAIRECFDLIFGDDYDVRLAADVTEAMQLLATETPRVVFLDVRLGAESGLDLLRSLKPLDRGLRVVMVTAACDERVERESRALGAAAFVRKPFDVAEVERLARGPA
jgi:two-component system response regulator (stage 0 sporulation protein F)